MCGAGPEIEALDALDRELGALPTPPAVEPALVREFSLTMELRRGYGWEDMCGLSKPISSDAGLCDCWS